jgi:hypothetical protein
MPTGTFQKLIAAAALLATWQLAGPAAAQNAAEGDLHLGVTSCAGSTCHGAAEPFANSPVLQNEYVTWQKYDPHAKAYTVLLEPRSKRIAANLNLSQPAHEARECLVCHSTFVPEELRGARFQLSDGVGCESCHGGSERYLGPHASGRVSHQANIDAGLTATEDPVVRAEMCLDCHFGNPDDPDQFVTHEIMGAGHPRMNFELDTFTAVQPAHYAMDADYYERKDVVDGVRTWAIGQALMIERRMTMLANPETGRQGMFPELVFFDCHACHEPMSQVDWVPRPGTGLGAGWPKFNDAHMIMLEAAMTMADPALAERMAANIQAVHGSLYKDQAALETAAADTHATARRAVEVLTGKQLSAQDMTRALATVAKLGAEGVYVDYEHAEQATMAMGAIIEAKKTAGHIDEGRYESLMAELEKAYAAIENDERYARDAFRDASQGLSATVN